MASNGGAVERSKRASQPVFATLIAVALALCAFASSAAARPGSLDLSFGKDGKVVKPADLGPRQWDSAPTGLVELPGGRIVLLAGQTLHGFKPNGLSASSFGGGTVKVAAPPGDRLDISGVAADSRGRILVAGGARSETGEEFPFVARYTSQGELDSSFADGGMLVTDLGLPGPRGTPAPARQIHAVGVAVDSGDDVVLTGVRLTAIGPCRGSVGLSYYEAFVARLRSNGERDPSFGEAGVVPLQDIQGVDPPAVDPDGKVYISTRLGACDEGRAPLIGRLDSFGRSDPSFGAGGWLQLSAGNSPESSVEFAPFSIALDSSSRLLLFGQHYAYPQESPGQPRRVGRRVVVVKRLLADGSLDPDFGRSGTATMSGPAGKLSLAAGAVDRLGRVLLAGTFDQSFFLSRLTLGGRIDRHFGKAGRVATSFGSRSRAKGSNLLIDGQGRAVVTGTLSSPLLAGGEGLALARFRTDR